MRKVGSDEYREHADYRRADAIKQLKSDKTQWICGPGKQQCTDRQSPEPDEEQRQAPPASCWPSNQRRQEGNDDLRQDDQCSNDGRGAAYSVIYESGSHYW